MNELNKSFNPSLLREKEVESICFLLYQINIYLSDGKWIQIEGRYHFFEKGKLLEVGASFPILQTALLRLLGKKITKIIFSATDKNVHLKFENDYELSLKKESDFYESYRFFDGKTEVVV